MAASKQELHARLAQFGQQHLLAFWNRLSEPQRHSLESQIENIDLALIDELFHHQSAATDWGALVARALAPPAFRLGRGSIGQGDQFSPDQARRRGAAALSAGQLGVILVAGGQGTRLGFDRPKGMYQIGPVSRASLFQILLEQVAARGRRHNVRIPLYIMTSPATHDETVAYLAEQRYFGLSAPDVTIFCQGTMPAVDAKTGKLLLAQPDRLALSPDGHGGMLAALAACGALKQLNRRGVEHLFYLQVDNPLVAICDPEFIGYHLLAGSELTSQVIAKQTPREKVGNVAMIDDRMQIIEYSDFNPLSDELVQRRTPDGAPVFWAGSIAVHVFAVAFLSRMAGSAAGLPFHIANKAVSHVDASGNTVEPRAPNAIKFERFIFDLLPLARRTVVVEVDQQLAFAPLKNAPGDAQDTPESVQTQMISRDRQWLAAAGAQVAEATAVEISPRFALDAEELASKLMPGMVVTEPRYFC